METENKSIQHRQRIDESTSFFHKGLSQQGNFLTIYIFLVLFGPKIGRYIDTSVITNLISLLIILKYKKNIVFSRKYFSYVLIVIFILIYLFSLMLLNGTFLIVQLGRYLRTIISIISIWGVVVSTNQNNETVIYSLIKVLSIHAALVLFTSLSIDAQETLAIFTGFEKKIRLFRSTGLMIGFDMSGLLCIVGYVISFTYPEIYKKRHRVKIMMLLFIIATIFTSRFSILSLIIIIVLLIIKNRKNVYKKFEVRLGLVFSIITLIPASILFIVTTTYSAKFYSLFTERFPYSMSIVNRFVSSYANTDIENTILNHFDFTKLDLISILLGAAENANQDPGYTIIIYSIGVVGLLLSVVWYFKIFIDTTRINKIFIENRIANEEMKHIQFTIYIMVYLTFMLSFKNNYFFTGTYFEILIIYITLSNKEYKEMRESDETKSWIFDNQGRTIFSNREDPSNRLT